MQQVMKENEHYGSPIKGQAKPSLLKPGAEKLGLTFRLAPKFNVQIVDLGNEHREYEITCSLYHIPTGRFVGEGVGNCNTKEGKYRYKSEVIPTGLPVPGAYWKSKDIEFETIRLQDLRNQKPISSDSSTASFTTEYKLP